MTQNTATGEGRTSFSKQLTVKPLSGHNLIMKLLLLLAFAAFGKYTLFDIEVFCDMVVVLDVNNEE